MRIVNQVTMATLGMGAAFTVLYGVADPLAAFAEVQTVEADGYYTVGDGPDENMKVARERAKADARQKASEKAGVFVESLSEVKMGELTRDEVRTISANVLEVLQDEPVTPVPIQVETSAGTLSVLRLHCHMVAKVDTANVMEQLSMDTIRMEEAVKKNQALEKELAAINEEVARIKGTYQKASDAEKSKLGEEMKANERRFEAMEWCRKGDSYGLLERGGEEKAVECYNKALEIDPTCANAYICLGRLYYLTGSEPDVDYFRKAVELEPNNALYWDYLGDAAAYDSKREVTDAGISYYKRATELDPTNPNYWAHLGGLYYNRLFNGDLLVPKDDVQKQRAIEILNKALDCLRKAADLEPDAADRWAELGSVHGMWRPWYGNAEEHYRLSVECYQRAVVLDPSYRSKLEDAKERQKFAVEHQYWSESEGKPE